MLMPACPHTHNGIYALWETTVSDLTRVCEPTNPHIIRNHIGSGLMGRIDAVIGDELEKRLRIRAVEVYGGKKGSLTEALEDAIQTWLDPEVREIVERHRTRLKAKSG